jgi:hypothetical protein
MFDWNDTTAWLWLKANFNQPSPMHDTPRITTHEWNPLFGTPPLILPQDQQSNRAQEREVAIAASREEASRESAMLRAMNEPPFRIAPMAPESVLRQPHLPDDFANQVADLDSKIHRKGIAIDRKRVLSLGRERFQQLLKADQEARQEQRVIGSDTDLTDFRSVYLALCSCGAIDAVPVPKRRIHEQLHGINQELDDVRQLSGYVDLFKVFNTAPRAVKAIYAFKDVFGSLIFGQSLLERISDDGRVRSRFFCGGSGERSKFFQDWLNVPHVITLEKESRLVLFWLMHQRGRADVDELAREFYRVRSPLNEQLSFVTALFEGFLRGHEGWNLWQYVGRHTRRPPEQFVVNRWHEELKRRFPAVRQFHHDLANCFMRRHGDHYQLDGKGYRKFVDRTVEALRNTLSAVVALAIEEQSPGIIVARFQNALWLEHEPKSSAKIADKLNAVFQ